MVVRDNGADRETKMRACEEVLNSRTFSRSGQLAQFLRYICSLELNGRGSEITEYSIAISALGRPPDYAPGEDSSVRSRAHALRRKLQEYYEDEATQAEVRIELPKGSYRPAFVTHEVALKREVGLEMVAHSVPAPAVLRLRSRERMLIRYLAGTAALVLVLGGVLLWRIFFFSPIDPLVRVAWGPVLQHGGDVLILAASPPLLRIIPSQPGKIPLGGATEVAPKWVDRWYASLNLEDRGGPVYLATGRKYAVFSDLAATAAITSLLTESGASYLTMPEYAVQPRAIHERGLVVIGAPSYAAYLARILKSTPYSIWFDPAANTEVLGPRPGSPGKSYLAKRNPQTDRYSTVYGLITVLPSQPGHPRPERMLIFAGFTGSPGAQAAIDFFRSPAALGDLKRRFLQEGYRDFPAAYQVVVRCGVDAETALNAVYETHVVMKTVPVIE